MSRQMLPVDSVSRCESRIEVHFGSMGEKTFVERIAERGALRLRLPKTGRCEGIIVNTAGGIVAGDRLALSAVLDPAAAVTLTSAAAEKVYRSCGTRSEIMTKFDLAAGSRLAWVPHETIIFDQADLARRFDIDCAANASLLAVETIQFGRIAHGEVDLIGALRDSWRVRRDGRLVYADETRINGAVGAVLDRRAVAAGQRAVATILLVTPDASRHIEGLRGVLSAFCSPAVEAAASLRDGIIVARALATCSERLRATVAAAVDVLDGFSLPPYWH